MRKLNPTAPALTAINSGLVVEGLHGSVYRTLAARADLDPGSQQLLVGGVGSGKTTELLLADRWLQKQPQTLPIYIDISAETDLSGLNSGAVLAGFGRKLAEAFFEAGFGESLPAEQKNRLKGAQQEIRDFAFGKTKSYFVPDEDYPPPPDLDYPPHFDWDDAPYSPPGSFVTYRVPGKLSPPPFPALQRDIEAIREPLVSFLSAVQSRSLDVVAILDGLDRLITPDKFWDIVHQDFRALREMRVAVLVAAPLSVLYGTGRPVSEHFDRVHHIATLTAEPDDNSYLKSVLSHRGGTDLLEPDGVELVCSASGGVLRDLIALARDAGETAYIGGSERILSEHVETAIRQLGESYLRGLGPAQFVILRRLAKERFFDAGSPLSIEMLVTRRVLEYSATDFRVHPALEPLIPKPD
ncbi:MAG: hypothetical protein NT090_18305 [Acidobacteria bacterium]|nr:hypothetical protein [Acidobacteriota bacterium]